MRTPLASLFADLDAFLPRWRAAMDADAVTAALTKEAESLGDRLVEATEATGQGPEQGLIAALAHYRLVENYLDDGDADEDDLIDAADALVSEVNAVLHG